MCQHSSLVRLQRRETFTMNRRLWRNTRYLLFAPPAPPEGPVPPLLPTPPPACLTSAFFPYIITLDFRLILLPARKKALLSMDASAEYLAPPFASPPLPLLLVAPPLPPFSTTFCASLVLTFELPAAAATADSGCSPRLALRSLSMARTHKRRSSGSLREAF